MLTKKFLYKIKYFYHLIFNGLMAIFYSFKLGFPQCKLKFIIVTGTDGKTTTASLLFHLLRNSKKKVGLISTVSAKINDEEIETGLHNTCLEIKDLYPLLKKMVNKKVEYVVLEATSQGIYQSRLFGIKPLISGITNITRDHLDYHLNYENYFKAKQLLLKKSKTIVLNADDVSFAQLNKINNHYFAYAGNLENCVIDENIKEDFKKINQEIKNIFSTNFNQANARLASLIVLFLGLNLVDLTKSLKSFHLPKGRQEILKVKNRKNLTFIVDFAHTPNALSNLLENVRKNFASKKQRIITVIGCTGRRDIGKRPEIGRICAEKSDLAIFTADDTYDEKIEVIIFQMKQDLKKSHDKIISVSDRFKAIAKAIELAKKNDIICLCGKGHEKSICLNGADQPWDEKEKILEALEKND
jgi:UDP-N-acetylmuramoyl-L-alanyl-D-glutamate--2,6-diaminopimelate ligase